MEIIPSAAALSVIQTLGNNKLTFTGLLQPNEIDVGFLLSSSISQELLLEKDILDIRNKKYKLLGATPQIDSLEYKELTALTENLLKLEFKKDLLSRIKPVAKNIILGSDFDSYFNLKGSIDAAVLSIDIRKSASMMLKASPDEFWAYLTDLATKLETTIRNNYGVFEKFTGDGILAFFPKPFSGPEALLFAIKSAQECLHIFIDHLKVNNHIFSAMLKDFGICSGIDFGRIHIKMINSSINIVGVPVVYSCRMSNGDSGKILLNHAAKKEFDRLNTNLEIAEKSIEVKNKGTFCCYEINANSSINPKKPEWDQIL
jgi:class 3 adenylate cyclase